ncbi:MAG: HAMP domain-containing histidine kinase [Deltaproteobacteria bacterium]|nr:HAMP domain-containing histidine kinase [Deltaproteobacteria bacterium]
MKFSHSLRKRIIIAFCLFGAVLGAVYGLIVYISLDFIDDHLVNSRLLQELDYFGARYQDYLELPPTSSPHMKAFIGVTAMPLYAKEMITGISEGIHERYYKGNEYHIAVKVVPNRTEPLYLIYDVSALEFTETRKLKIGTVLAAGVILIAGLGLWIGLLTSRKVIAPVVHLAEQVNRSGPENLPTDLSESFYNDEVGVLAKALEQAIQRIEAFVQREKKFTRDASHELRTPVTVIKGALEVLKKQSIVEGESASRPLNRIGRAVADMENIIETFLWLGREDSYIENGQVCKVLPIIEEVIEQSRHLFAEKPVEIDLIAENEPILNVAPTPFQAVMANLIQNAMRHSAGGKITIQICKDRITVSDTGEGIAPCDLPSITQPYVRGDSSKGSGLGLAIVKRLCERMGWHFEIESDVGKGTMAQLYFQPPLEKDS